VDNGKTGMTTSSYILAIDQGTTSTRAIVFDEQHRPVATAQQEFPQLFPAPGWVEHNPDDLWNTVLATCRAVLAQASVPLHSIRALGIANQRETTLVWHRQTGRPLCNAIVWQDRRTAAFCQAWQGTEQASLIAARTGLVVDPYFSATKLKWILDHVPEVRALAHQGDALFGTVDSFLIWKLTAGRVHATDATNAARTMLYDIGKGRWSQTICDMLDIPMEMLPSVHDSAADFGQISEGILPISLPICGVAGDQQAATIGQACFQPGMLKSTYGTGCFALLNTGGTRVSSRNRLLTTIAYQLDGKPTYALEGSIFVAGAVVQWLRDGLQIIEAAPQTQHLAQAADAAQPLVLVPAFTGLGAPYWQPDCRGALFGLTRNSGRADLARAALESVGYQTRDLLEAMRADWQGLRSGETKGEAAKQEGENVLRVDGGMSASDWTMQFLSDIIAAPVDRPKVLETTALGAAWLAGVQVGVWPGQDAFARQWALDRRFSPTMDTTTRAQKYDGWQRAVRCAMGYHAGTAWGEKT